MNIGIFDRYRSLIVLPPFLWIILFIVVALFLLLIISFSEPEFAVIPYKSIIQVKSDKIEITPDFNSYQVLFHDSFYLKALTNSLTMTFIATIFTFILAYPIAYFISRDDLKKRLLLLVLVIAPFWTALLIRVYGWIIILKNNGLLNEALIKLGLINQHITFLNTKSAVIIGIVYTYLPFMILPIYSSLIKIKPNILEAAADLGAKPFAIFWKITFPLSIPGIIVGTILVFIPAVGEFVIPDLLGGAKIITIGKLLWTEFFMNRDWPMAASITIVMVFIVVIPIKIVHRFMENK